MTSWAKPFENSVSVIGSNADVVTTATPLAMMKGGEMSTLMETYTLRDMLLGGIPGSLGEVCSIALLLGGVYLLWRGVINWHTPVCYIATVAALTFLFPHYAAGLSVSERLVWMLYNVLGGGLILGAFFMATDYATSPVSKKGQVVFGIGCGLFTVMIRYFGSYNEGVCYSIMVMNLFVPLIDNYTRPRRFGTENVKKEAAA